jgi:hypothetical protein
MDYMQSFVSQAYAYHYNFYARRRAYICRGCFFIFSQVPIFRVWSINLMMIVLDILSCSYLASSLVNILCLLLEF